MQHSYSNSCKEIPSPASASCWMPGCETPTVFCPITPIKRGSQNCQEKISSRSRRCCSTRKWPTHYEKCGQNGTSTAKSVVTTIKEPQPLTWDIVIELCARPPQRRNGVAAVRKNQPVDGVSSYLIDLCDSVYLLGVNAMAIR